MIELRKLLSAALAALAVLAAGGAALEGAHAAPEERWHSDEFKNPESVVRDANNEFYYVSNINGAMLEKDGNGFISKIRPDGTMVEAQWLKGLNAPKGMAISGNTMFIADIDELVIVDIGKAEITGRLPVKDAKFLNDVAAAPDGRVFVSDSGTNTIWLHQNGGLAPWVADPILNAPNGLAVEGERLIVASIGTMPHPDKPGRPGHLLAVSLSDKKISDLGDGSPVGYLDGVEPLGGGRYLATDFINGALYKVDASGKSETLMPFEHGAADLAYDPGAQLAIVPLTSANAVMALKVD